MQRFENYVNMKGVDGNKTSTKLLLNSIGAKYFDRVTALAASRIETELQYEDLLKLLERNVLEAEHKFL